MTDDPAAWERQLFLERYKADRQHELELDRIVASYELRFLQVAGVLNGAAVTLFLSFFGATAGKVQHLEGKLFAAASVAWIAGLLFAVWAGAIAYTAQDVFNRVVRLRRNAAGLRIGVEQYRRATSLRPQDSPERLTDDSQAAYREAAQGWGLAKRIGFVSIGMFVLGSCLALWIVVSLTPAAG